MNKLVAVIGSGVAGLAAAALLANKNYKVTVYEKEATYGGKLGLLKLGQAIFDTGPSLGTEPEVIDSIFIECNKDPRNYWNYKSTKELTRYFWLDGTKYIMPTGSIPIKQSLIKTFDLDPGKVGKLFDIYNYQYKIVAPEYLDKPFRPGSLDNLKIINKLAKAVPLMMQTAHGFNNRYLSNKKAVQLFDRFATYSGSDPYRGPALLDFAGSPELTDGVFYPTGGMRSIADGLYKLCLDKGVEFEFSHSIDSIKKSSLSYLINNSNRRFDTVIYNGDSARLYDLLDETKRAKKSIKNERSTSGVVFYWQVKGHYKELGLHNIIFSSNYKKEFKDIKNGNIPEDPTIYINITSKIEPKLARPGHENWFVMINAPAGISDSNVNNLRQTVVRRIEGVLNTKLLIDEEDNLTPTKIQKRDNAYHGAIYGQSSNNPKIALFKQPNEVKGYDNLFCVGGTVHPGGGVPLSIRSAKIVASQL